MKLLMGTKNPGKIEGARRAFLKYFDEVEIEGVSVNSEVSDQPTNEEIINGAKNRVKNVRKYAEENNIKADFYIASEAGITNSLCDDWIDINAAYMEDASGESSVGISQGFKIAEKYVDEVLDTELGKVMDKIFSKNDLGKQKGGINFLTKDQVSRIDLTENAFVMALIPYINGDLWK